MPPKTSKSLKKEIELAPKPINTGTDAIQLKSGGDISIRVFAKPGSKENQVVGISEEDGLEVKIAAPAVDGEANAELISFLSKVFNVRKSNVSLEKGNKSRNKVVTISRDTNLSIDRIREIINDSINQ